MSYARTVAREGLSPFGGVWPDRPTVLTGLSGLGVFDPAALPRDASDPRWQRWLAAYKADQNRLWDTAIPGTNAMYQQMRQEAWDRQWQQIGSSPPTARPPDEWNRLDDIYVLGVTVEQTPLEIRMLNYVPGGRDTSGIVSYLQAVGFTDYEAMGSYRITRPSIDVIAGSWPDLFYAYMTAAEQAAVDAERGYVPPPVTVDFPGDPGRPTAPDPWTPGEQTVTLTTPDGEVITHQGPIPRTASGDIDWRALGVDPARWEWEAPLPPPPEVPSPEVPSPEVTPDTDATRQPERTPGTMAVAGDMPWLVGAAALVAVLLSRKER